MIQINQELPEVYQAKSAFVIFQSMAEKSDIYVEAYEIGEYGRPINAHPLSDEESIDLAISLAETKDLTNSFLQSKSLMPENILFLDLGLAGFAVWYTPAQTKKMNFTPNLNIDSGICSIPALVWKATKKQLFVYAIQMIDNTRPNITTTLFHAPFFNVYDSGQVCMGNVNVKINEQGCIEDFMKEWEDYFFDSYFSETMVGHKPVNTDICKMWNTLVDTTRRFPLNVLKTSDVKFKNLLS